MHIIMLIFAATIATLPTKDELRQHLTSAFLPHRKSLVSIDYEYDLKPPKSKQVRDIKVWRDEKRLKITVSESVMFVDKQRAPVVEPFREHLLEADRSLHLFANPKSRHATDMLATLEDISLTEKFRHWGILPDVAFGYLFFGFTLADAISDRSVISEEILHGKPVIKVASRTEYGAVELWLDPAASYMPRRTLRRTTLDDLTHTREKLRDQLKTDKDKKLVELVDEFVDITIDTVGMVFVVTSCTKQGVNRYRDGELRSIGERFRLRDWRFPEHIEESDFQFSSSIPEGLRVDVVNRPTILHEWRDGKIVKVNPAAVVSKLEGFPIYPGDSTRYYVIAGALVFCLAGLLFWRWRLSIQEA